MTRLIFKLPGILKSLVLLLLWSCLAFGESVTTPILEQKLRQRLDQLFQPDQYFLDINLKEPDADSALQTPGNNGELLPGFEMLGPVLQKGKSLFSGDGQQKIEPVSTQGDLLLIIDKKVSKERVEIAKQIIKRVIDNDGISSQVKVDVRHQDIAHPAEQVSANTQAQTPNPSAQNQPAAPLKPELSWFELIEKNKPLVINILLVAWGAIISLMAAWAFFMRYLGSSGQRVTQANRGRVFDGTNNGGGDGRSDNGNHHDAQQSLSGDARKRAANKDELYSKDEALLKKINEIVGETQDDPKKVAKVITRWVAQSDENAKFAGILLKNCSIKAVENICAYLHPSDLEKIFNQKITDFDPFSSENESVLERMRNDLALLAAEQIIKERPDPFEFMRSLSDDDLIALLQDENDYVIAMVATQVPAHRLNKFFSLIPKDRSGSILLQIAQIKSPDVGEFNKILEKIQPKVQRLSANMFSEKSKVQTLIQLLTAVSSPLSQYEILADLKAENQNLYQLVRSNVLTAVDFDYAASRVVSVLVQVVEAEVLGSALSGFDREFTNLIGQLPETYRAIFIDALSREDDSQITIESWKKTQQAVRDLVGNGMISQAEVSSMIRQCEFASSQTQDSSLSNKESESAA